MVGRFVLLEHDHPFPHWDFLLEHEGVLKSWRLLERPRGPGQTIAATRLGDHRLAYLVYEGPVSGDRGTVQRWDQGTFGWVEGDWQDGFVVHLEGDRVRGSVRMERIEDNDWRFTWVPLAA